jgi:drug/metabolite transporter (DMT)-like permease
MMASGRLRLGLTAVDLALLGVPVVWGVNYAVIKAALRELQPMAFNGIRFALATATIGLLLRRRGSSLRIPREGLWRLALLGVLGNAVYQLLFIEGIARTTASNASLIMASAPMVVALLATALGREKLKVRGWLGVAFAVTGLTLVVSVQERAAFTVGSLAGDVLVFGAAVTWALYTVLASGIMARTPSLSATLVTFLSGTPVLLLMALPSLASQDWRRVGAMGWVGVGFSGIVAIGLGYLAWNTGLGAIGSTRTVVYSNLTPVIAALLGWATLGEKWTPAQVFGAAVVLVGVVLTRTAAVDNAAAPRGQPQSGPQPT